MVIWRLLFPIKFQVEMTYRQQNQISEKKVMLILYDYTVLECLATPLFLKTSDSFVPKARRQKHYRVAKSSNTERAALDNCYKSRCLHMTRLLLRLRILLTEPLGLIDKSTIMTV